MISSTYGVVGMQCAGKYSSIEFANALEPLQPEFPVTGFYWAQWGQ
jgi:hypothetical protein